MKGDKTIKNMMNNAISVSIVNFFNIIISIYLFEFGYYEVYNKNFGLGNTVILPVLLLIIAISGDVIISFIFLSLDFSPASALLGTLVCQLIFQFIAAFVIAILSVILVFIVTVIMSILGVIFGIMIVTALFSS